MEGIIRPIVGVLVVGCSTGSSVPLSVEDLAPDNTDMTVAAVWTGLTATPLVSTASPPDTWDSGRQTVHGRRTTHTHAGVSVAVWSELADREVRLWAQWADTAPRIIDRVQSSSAHAAQSARSLFDVAIAAHGEDRVGVAWRPLVDDTNPVAAELRWATLRATDEVRWHRQAMRVWELGATTGVGPYPYGDSRLRAAELDDAAVFVWMGDAGVRAVLADDATPIALSIRSVAQLQLEAVDDGVQVTGYDYWCADGTTHSSSCRSMEAVVLRISGCHSSQR